MQPATGEKRKEKPPASSALSVEKKKESMCIYPVRIGAVYPREKGEEEGEKSQYARI